MSEKGGKSAKDKKLEELKKNADMTEHREDLQEVFRKLGSSEAGLTQAAATNKLAEDGPNRLTPPPTTPKWIKFVKEMTGFFSLLLWGGGVLCFIAYGLRKEVDNMYLGIVLFCVVFITGCFSFYQNNKSEDLMNSFKALLPPEINVCRDGKFKRIPAENIVKGDILEITGGELVPCDVRILECTDNCVVDNASLTGEAEPQKRKADCTHDDPLETANLAFFGTSVPEGSLKGVVVNTGDDTVMGKIAALTLNVDAGQTPINKEIHHFIMIISTIAIVLGISFFIAGYVLNPEPIANLVFLISIIVANVPEGLLATVTVCLTLTARRMHSKMVLVKNLEGVETLGSTSCICSDKTGTLTQNVMTVAQIVYGNTDDVHIQDAGSSLSHGVRTYEPSNGAFKNLLRCCMLNNTARFTGQFEKRMQADGQEVDDPSRPIPFMGEVIQGDGSSLMQVMWGTDGNASEAAMIKFAQQEDDVEACRQSHNELFQIPFNSRNKYQVHVVEQAQYNDGSYVYDPAAASAAAPVEEEVSVAKGAGMFGKKKQAAAPKPAAAAGGEAFKPKAGPSGNNGPRVVLMKGAPERVLIRCDKVNLNGRVVELTDELRAKIEEHQVTMSANGLRVLGFAELELDVNQYPCDYKFNDGQDEDKSTPNFPLGEFALEADRAQNPPKMPIHENSVPGLVFLGLMALIDPPRPAVPGAVEKCKTAGIKVIMVTGDHPVTAQAIAAKVGILWSKTRGQIKATNEAYGLNPGDMGWEDPENAEAIVVPGWELQGDVSEEQWRTRVQPIGFVFARTSPQQKLAIVSENQKRGHIVAVTGDGVNDSPALKQADIGVAMGISGSEVSKQAADMILLDDNFASIVAGVEEGRLIFDNLKKSICYTLTSNIPEISPFLCFTVLGTPLPLSTVLILGIDLGTDMVPAISMAYEEAEADIMKRPPRDSKIDRLVTKKLIVFAYLQIGMIQAAAGFYTWMVVLNDYGFPPHILPGLSRGDLWQKHALFCKFSGGQYVSVDGEVSTTLDPSIDAPTREFPFWDVGDHGNIENCEYPLKNLKGGSGSPSGFDLTEGATYDSSSTSGSNQITYEAIMVAESKNYYAYTPWRARQSPFWKNSWLYWDTGDAETAGGAFGGAADITYFYYQKAGLWSLCAADSGLDDASGSSTFVNDYRAVELFGGSYDMNGNGACDSDAELDEKLYNSALFCDGYPSYSSGSVHYESSDHYDACAEGANDHLLNNVWCDSCDQACFEAGGDGGATLCANVGSRMAQKEALHHAQGAYFVSIVIVQWADLLICKTRWLSLRQQGMTNSVMNFALFFETLLAGWLCYFLPINVGLGTRNLRFTHWFPAIPFSMAIFMYDEVRKGLMRISSPEVVDKATGQVVRQAGWLETNTYY
eukprot:CAMPEP_0206397180 /NCGR_PEP_ID=MMETSP0294-20121207/23281_1 /ASSEMBLY_ACC=CAM_ASM_000327 /TAXON_ID=39354 /ORGANISM="Heterosigma akashiwo, Strain CCMP2393" /LENGTH=1388 /DNA_ID=CAMNT_0053852161 /DNA_START=101 /DNA_END=4267 /DNA_ORIENTATION=-